MKKRVLLLVPARFQSSRFPGKPLALIANKSMISRVMENMSELVSDEIDFVSYAVTDDPRIEKHLKDLNLNVVRVDDDVNSGTLRIELAYERFFKSDAFDLIINVQGDEPLLLKNEIVKLSHFHLSHPFDIATMAKKQTGFDQNFNDPNKVKIVFDEVQGKAFYFSRSSIPFKRDLSESSKNLNDYWFYHIGVYSFTPNALTKFATFKESRLEALEKLEQLRALENGLNIGAMVTNCELIGVDTPEDIEKVEKILRGN
jgi:3-deoxy-manno-octulosonate cytidylyltransferase (CMP-KDO synthetase)